MIYYLLLTIFGVLGLFFTCISEKQKRALNPLLISVCFILLFIVGGLRHEVGTDWDSYKLIYTLGLVSVEPLFMLMNSSLQFLGFSYGFFIAFIFVLATSFKFFVINNYSPNFFLSLLTYFPIIFMVYDINAIRQGLAIAIAFMSIKYILSRSSSKFFILMIIGICIHSSVIFFIPLYWFAGIDLSKKQVYMILFITILGSFASKYFLDFFAERFGAELFLMQKLESYSRNENYNSQLTFNLSTVYRIIILLIFLHRQSYLVIKHDLFKLIRNGYLLSLIIYFTCFSVEIIATRGSLILRCFDILIFAFVIESFKDILIRISLCICLYVYCGLQVYKTLSAPDNGLLPYNNIIYKCCH